MIAGALAESTVEDFSLPNPPAFSAEEIEIVDSWVSGGGSLLLVAGTQPAPAAAAALAERFGVLFGNGIAVPAAAAADWTQADWMQFRRADGSLRDHPISWGRQGLESVDSVMTFAGQAFRAKPGVDIRPLLVFTGPTVLTSTRMVHTDRPTALPGYLSGEHPLIAKDGDAACAVP